MDELVSVENFQPNKLGYLTHISIPTHTHKKNGKKFIT